MSRSTVAPPNYSLTKLPVLKPAPGRTSWNKVPLATPKPSFNSFSQTRKHVKIFVFIEYFVVWSSHETFVKKHRRFRGGLS